jgi:hypothetical protein
VVGGLGDEGERLCTGLVHSGVGPGAEGKSETDLPSVT